MELAIAKQGINDQSIHKWIHEGGFVTEKGEPLTFQDHQFLFQPYRDFSQRQVYKKASQVGVSVMMNTKVPYALGTYQWNVIYTLPADRDVYEFVPTKTDKIIANNPVLRKALGVDKMELKEMWGRFWHLKGTRSKTAAIMTTADLLVHDEKDRSDQGIIEDYRSRIKKSTYRGIWELSNPSVKNTGVDIAWNRSDQKEWVVRCEHCEMEQILNWYENVDYNQSFFKCKQCGKEISDLARRLGRWEETNGGSEVSGYHISQMMAPWITAKELIAEEAETDEEYFNNFVLGEPIGAGEAEDFRQILLDAWTPDDLTKGRQFMGVDIGSTKHYVIGDESGIHTIGKLKTRQELELLIEHWNPIVVMDAGPERTWAEEFRQKYPKLWICFYKQDKDKKKVVRWGEKEDAGIVYADRSRSIDKVVTNLVYADIQLALKPKVLESYIKHWMVMVKKKEVDKLGRAQYKWDKNTEHAQDHWVHATVYYDIARSRGSGATFVQGREAEKKNELITQGPDGEFKMDLKDYFRRKSL